MADGLNDARAMRITEIMTDFRNLQHYMAQIQMNPSADEYYLEGYNVLRACIAETQAILAEPFGAATATPRDLEGQKAQLQAVIVDAAVRRFRCQRAYLKATACLRWVQSRYQVTQGQAIHQGHVAALQSVDATLRAELASVTDAQVEYSLRAPDAAAGKWIAEDPSLATILSRVRSS